MEQLTPGKFYADMQSAGAGLTLPAGARANLSIALGGVGSNLESLVRLYSALGNQGSTLTPNYLLQDAFQSKPLLSTEAAWIIRQMLKQDNTHLAIKTGTSYSHRDAWAIGISDYYTLGVWVGKPDGTPMVGHYGNFTAVPLLKSAARYLLPLGGQKAHAKPENVDLKPICWPHGQHKTARCDEEKTAWLIDEIAPHTLMSTLEQSALNMSSQQSYLRAVDSGLRVALGCVEQSESIKVFVWPAPLQQWIKPEFRNQSRIPKLDARCEISDGLRLPEPVTINGIEQGQRIKYHSSTDQTPVLNLTAIGGQPDWYWFLNGELIASESHQLTLELQEKGRYQLTLLDQAGMSDAVDFWVE